MATVEKTVRVEPGSELAHLLDEAGNRPLVLIKNGARFRVTKETSLPERQDRDPWADYDPEKLMEEARSIAGIITPEEAEEWIANIYRWRAEGSRPPDRP